ncbi:GNAT family N-acetyltransferase [Desulfotomaculum copahuensis]|uniref:Acetoin dehydrogenase n=1 Tax=Desulfotomaculum copahuensis TaxID=1838280 RepID=A0A1B7LEV3_9FIRM|nr:GNAT family N-acetyltransferase [Desulfotomaculum copahuensis]OAT81766.1 acetoin dehydrogenase [Desulfotomaculum copahuensis]
MSATCCEMQDNHTIYTPAGTVFLEGPVGKDDLEPLTLDPGLKNFRLPERQKVALQEIAALPEGMVFIARVEKLVAGYVTFHFPEKYSRWSKHPRVLELGAIEVSPDWREFKLARQLLQVAFANPVMEEYIVIAIEFCWHWDLKNTALDIWQYQKMLTRLFGSAGLKKVQTDDPDITEHMANVLMARYGSKVSPADVDLFKQMLFMAQGTFPQCH